MNMRQTLLFAFCLFILATGFAHAALVVNDDSYGIPASRVLLVEPFGVLDNDTLDDQNAGENGVTAILHTDVSKGTLSCPDGGSGLCPNGSFEYTPGPGFDGTDSFVYQAVSSAETSSPTTVTLSACTGVGTVYTCWLESAYLDKLSELGYSNVFVESFEGAAWEIAREPVAATSIESKGIIWTSNHTATNGITTGTGKVRTGVWGVYDPDHGFATGSVVECNIDNPPEHCLPYDGFSGSVSGSDVLYGVGGYITGIFGANIAIVLGTTIHDIGKVTGAAYDFFGVIDTAGFNEFQFRELDGKLGQELFIWGDDFIIATSGAIANNSPVLTPVGDQATDENVQLSIMLNASDLDDGDIMSFSMSGEPSGATLLDNKDGTAEFFWKPDYSQAGSYPVTFTVIDNAIPAATASETITITVNDVNRPPVLSPIGDKSVDENTELSFLLTASDPDGNNLSFVKSGGPTAASLVDHGDGTATFSWTPNIGQAGDHAVTFTVSDNGVPVASDLETITITVIDPVVVDITPPQVQILSPANGAGLTSSPVAVTGTASDETALAGVTVNGVAATLGSGTFSADVALVEGANSITAIATDSSGNTTSTSIQVTYTPPDVTPPQVQILSPANGASLNGSPVTVSGTASDETALSSVTVNGVVATLGSGTFSASVPLVEGNNTLTAIATDSSGNSTSTSIQVTYTPPDVTPPQVQILSPVNGATQSSSPVTVSGTASDETALAGVTVNGVAATVVGGTFSASVPLVEGNNTLTAIATDSSGNSTSTSIQVTYTPPDITPPQVQILSPVNGATLSGSPVTVSGTASDETALAGVTVNGVAATVVGGNFSADVPLVAGTNTLTAIATDSSGNSTSTSIQVSYVVNAVPVADAGTDQTAFVGETVTLDGSASSDADGDMLTFSWSLTTVPAGSAAVLSDTAAVNPTFTVDVSGTYIAQLIVNDGSVSSLADTVNISTTNSVPVADAGTGQTAFVGETVTLDGSASSDVDGDMLTFSWSLTTVPAGSAAVLSDTAAVNPTFTVDVSGTYIAQLIVNDGSVNSLADTVNISTINSAPVADAGTDQNAFVGDSVTLDGSASSDVDGDMLTFSWSLTTVPAGSAAVLSDPAAVNPAFTVDVSGTYVAQLIVNDGLVDSLADTVSISTINSAPVADAGADQNAFVGDNVTLDGSASSDVDGDMLTFSWSLTTVPAGSAAVLSGTAAVNPTFTVDISGTYVAQLIVNDGIANSVADTVSISTLNSAPVADAGMDQSVLVNDSVMLDGSGSSDVDGDTLTFIWSLTTVPAGSAAVLSDTTAVSPTFDADLEGTYVVQLIVNDGVVDSAADTVSITVNAAASNISVTLTPDSTIVPRGGVLGYTVEAINNTGVSQTFNYWSNVTLPNSSTYPTVGELFGPVTVTLAPGSVRSAHLTHSIPTNAPLGAYIYHGFVGSYPAVLDEGHFNFDVTAQ